MSSVESLGNFNAPLAQFSRHDRHKQRRKRARNSSRTLSLNFISLHQQACRAAAPHVQAEPHDSHEENEFGEGDS